MRWTVWVVFLVVLPMTMALAGDPVRGKSKILLCVGCHGFDGNSTDSQYPKLAGQGEAYLSKQIHDFKTGKRKEEHMTSMVRLIKTEDIPDIVAYFSSLQRKPHKLDKVDTELGERIYHAGIKRKGVTACASCHGKKGQGVAAAKYPALATQYSEYVMKTLKDFRSGVRSNDVNKVMRNIATKLNDNEIEALSTYIAGLK